ncbi:hypothetical protein FOQG_15252 [Fusarium oxysporum f. sp. raphani 54005]|uniref:Uncharacterized protein n=3 Tax=Fusarium oxysporum TaxID=5507 RepID=X0BEF9_FUSOX|nr:hypothetical protein FOQG_15252 [Fusarium oxysporum f. sp. raphani 54005]EXL67846.1 hypothetical protein FOPG_16046 [Fusarium oxysporum f. sp. conglutinans race 2 54008]KAJ4031925.1 hypothetical protein NW758_012216 [Fusarium oxysporum]
MEDAAVELEVWSAHHAPAFAQQFRQNHLQRRRDRNCLAQSEFRKGQRRGMHDLKAQMAAMKAAIADIFTEVRQDDRPEPQGKIRQAAVAA